MSEKENDQHILTLISQIFVDILNGTTIWNLPNSYSALINFSGREMNLILQGVKNTDQKIKRKITFTVDALTQFAIKLILHSLQIGRYVNRIRVANGKQEIDWYKRAIEEDQSEKKIN